MKKKFINAFLQSRKAKKWFLMMKLTIVLLMAGLMQVSATVYSQATKFNFRAENKQIAEVLKEIEDNSDFRFFYIREQVNVERKVTVNANGATVEQILDELFAGQGISHKVMDDNLVLLSPDSRIREIESVSAQQKQVSGSITDAKGQPLVGVTIVIKGTISGTVSDVNGNYQITSVPDDATLIFSFIGMKSQEIAIGANNTIDVVMAEVIIGIEDVVVTALGIKREEKALGYSVQKVDGETLNTVKGIDVGTSLTGKVAGMLVKNSPEFAAEPVIEIRGENPLLVIDGVPYGNMKLRDIPSDDIETISVLKGATASALYGSRGASGAIMVTTYRGSANKGFSVTLNSSTMFNAGYLAIPELQSTYGRVVKTNAGGQLEYVRSGDGAWGAPLEGQTVIQWDPVSKTMMPMPFNAIGADNFNNFLEQGYILNNNVNIVQQGDNGSLRASASWVQNKGQYPNSVFDKITYSLAGEIKIDKFILSSGMTYNKHVTPNKGFSGYTGYDPMYSMLIWGAPDWDVRQYKDYWLIPNEVQNNSYTAGNNNPYFDRHERTHSVNKDIFNGTLALSYDFTKWLKGTLRTGYDTYSDRQDITVSKGSFQGAGSATMIPNGTQVWGESQKGSYNLGLSRGFSSNNDLIFNGDYAFGDFKIEGLAGGSLYFGQDEGIETRSRGGLSIPGFYSLKASVDPVIVNSMIYKRQVNSLYGRLGVSYQSFAFAEATFRNDWVSTLPEATRSYSYPSVSGSLLLSELLPETSWLSLWKIRSSWVTVKTPASIYAINPVFSITNNAWGTLSSASLPSTIRGTEVLPESSATWEFGTVVNLLKNRASIDATYYAKRMFDFLRSTGISPASGYSGNYINTDEEITRKGFEIAAKVTPVKTNDWNWDISANWSKYARYYTQLDSLYSADRPWVKEGERADAFVLRNYQKDPNGNIIHNASGLPLYSSYDSRFGYADPDWIWGIGTSLKYKSFVLNVSLDGRVGGLAQSITEMYMWRSGNHPESVTPERYLDATVAGSKNYTGEGVKVIAGTVTYDTYGNITSDTREYAPNDVATTYKTYVENLHKGTAWGGAPSPTEAYSTSFLKIREMSLTYYVPQQWASKIGARDVSISAIGQNVFYWAKQFKYSDIDGGSENFVDPSQRYLGFNVKLGF